MEKTIYNLKLHEKINIEYIEIIRVAGGWIYRFWNDEEQDYTNGNIFVPFNSEFKEEEKRNG